MKLWDKDGERLNGEDALWAAIRYNQDGKYRTISPRSFKWGKHYKYRCCYLVNDFIVDIFNKCCGHMR